MSQVSQTNQPSATPLDVGLTLLCDVWQIDTGVGGESRFGAIARGFNGATNPDTGRYEFPEGWKESRFDLATEGHKLRNVLADPLNTSPFPTRCRRRTVDLYYNPATHIRRARGEDTCAPEQFAVWGDVDRADALDRLAAFPLPATYAKASGTPGHAQALWLLSEPVDPLTLERINCGLAHRLDGDTSKGKRNSLLRVAGYCSHKRGVPTPVRIVAHRPEARYTLADFVRAGVLDGVPADPYGDGISTGTGAADATGDSANYAAIKTEYAYDLAYDAETAPAPYTADGLPYLIELVRQTRYGSRLWDGKWRDCDGWYDSQNAADMALCAILWRYTSDPHAIDWLFRRSGLMRDKWKTRPVYRKRTIERAAPPELLQQAGDTADTGKGGARW